VCRTPDPLGPQRAQKAQNPKETADGREGARNRNDGARFLSQGVEIPLAIPEPELDFPWVRADSVSGIAPRSNRLRLVLFLQG
jgi:hypothetical protein